MDKAGYLLNVRARIEIAKKCQGGKFENIGSLFEDSDEKKVKNLFEIAKILNNEYIRRDRKSKGLEVDINANYSEISYDEVLDMSMGELEAFEEGIVSAIINEKPTVEAEPSKKGKKTEKSK